MAITIQPLADTGTLRVSGDVDTILHIPADIPRPLWLEGEENGELVDTYYITVSDGTIIRASHCIPPRYEVVIEGAGLVEVEDDTGTLRLGWSVEWVGLASNRNTTAVAQQSVHNLPLFLPELGRVTAII